MTLSQILENDNIKADRFGMAAISYIYKAFGDDVRSKAYWPWSEKVNFPWSKTQGPIIDLNNAILCINKSITQLQNGEFDNFETSIIIAGDEANGSIREYRKQLRELETAITRIKETNEQLETDISYANQTVEELLQPVAED